MKWNTIFVYVTCGALVGMAMGMLLGLGAALLAPEFFEHVLPRAEVGPKGIGAVLGGIYGVLLGGLLSCFGIMIQIFREENRR